MSVVVLDTDVASALFRRRLPEPLTRQLAGQVAAVTFVTIGELSMWRVIRHWGPSNVARLRSLLDSLLILPWRQPGRDPLGRVAGLCPDPRPLSTGQRHLGRVLCLVRELPLATFNTKDYVDFAEHEGVQLLP